ncbi:MAG TPA: elongation factor P maturation arginine rhamnosyltransferase EarP [Fluviicoccus sp.]|nr:elongation factor P maturation arginine rhamnosyltransferase EarP [Fluviicoccus sp.]
MKSLDLFCTVIDNFGDIGVCRRLALQLHREYGHAVRLWVDDLYSFSRLSPELDTRAAVQNWQGLEVRHWVDGAADGVTPADIVIEGFACRLPESFMHAMAQRQPAPLWLNLEYLSAEDWTLGCHGLPSPHPRLPLRQYFFFPGFDPRGGGLLREQDLLTRRDAFQQDPDAQQVFWEQLNCPGAMQAGKRISLFAYENPAVPALLMQLAGEAEPVFLAVPEGRVLAEVSRWCGRELRAGDRLSQGSLSIAVLPFLSPDEYDRLLWACDLNFVRGEDSFIRAHWAGRPLVWHIYPQDDEAHMVKLEAWLALCRKWLPESWLELQRQWNHGAIDAAGLFRDWPEVIRGSADFSRHLSAQPDLAARLEEFCAER